MKNTKPIPVGISNFKEIIDGGYYYVDKTMFIEEYLNMGCVNMILRPGGFGKSVNLSMLRTFLEKSDTDNDRYFKGTEIWNRGEECWKHFGEYDVVYLDFGDCDGFTDSEILQKVDLVIEGEANRHGVDVAKVSYNNGWTVSEIVSALRTRTQQRVVVLVDNYDVPLLAARKNGCYKKVAGKVLNIYGRIFKNNCDIKFSLMLGNLGIPIDPYFDNHVVSSINRNDYQTRFGFTDEEVKQLLKKYKCDWELNVIRSWYGGYHCGDTLLCNSASVMEFLAENGKPKAYEHLSHWPLNLCELHPCDRYLCSYDGVIRNTMKHKVFIANDRLRTSAWLSCLVHFGYLTYDSDAFYIPNREALALLIAEREKRVHFWDNLLLAERKDPYAVKDAVEVLENMLGDAWGWEPPEEPLDS